MYKISEEDSQDEEVLNSFGTQVCKTLNHGGNNNNNVTPLLRVKPIPPAKPAFLRKPILVTTGFSGVGNHTNNNVTPLPPSMNATNNFTFTGDKSVSSCATTNTTVPTTTVRLIQPTYSSSDEVKTRQQPIPTTTSVTIDPDENNLGWPSSTDTQTGESGGDDSGGEEVVNKDRNLDTPKSTTTAVPSSSSVQFRTTPQQQQQSSSYKKTKRHTRRVESGRVQNNENRTSEENESSTQSDESFCSSCDERRSDQDGHFDDHSDDNGSYYGSTDHPESGSDLEFDSENDTLFEEELASLITEAEIQSWIRGDGSVLLCEYVPATNGPEISESANDKSGLHSKSKSIHPSLYSSIAPGAPEIESGLHQPQDNPNPNKGAKGKISRLLKRGVKQKKEIRNLEGGPSKTDSSNLPSESTMMEKEVSKNLRKPGANKVFRFKDEHEGEIRVVELFIKSYSKRNLGRRATMVESLLGIVPSRFSSRTASDRSNSSVSKIELDDKRIMVAGFIPDGPAAKNKQIKIGDWLQRVNGILVDFSNANSALLQILQKESDSFESPIKISLELQRVSGYTITDAPTKTVTFGDLVNERDPSNEKQSNYGVKSIDNELPSSELMSKIAVIYISVVNPATPESVPKEKTKDVIFTWPSESESRKVKALAASHGMFSTLYKLLKDVTGSHPVVSRVMIDEEEMDVVYCSDDEGKSLLLLATATVLSNFNICHSASGESSTRKEKKLRWKDPVDGGLGLGLRLMTRVEFLLKFQFGSLSRAFRTMPEEKLNHFFMGALAGGVSDISEDFLFPQVPEYFLRIPSRVRCSIDERLYSFETSDSFALCYGRNSVEFEKPLFNCLGSCLYYKGMPVVSHMERKLASHFHGFWRTQLGYWSVKRNTLPYLWEPVTRLILWQETFLPQNANDNQDESLGDNKNCQAAIQPCCSVLVGIGNLMLGTILEPAIPVNGILKPDPAWLQRGFNCVLRILKSEIHPSLERWILSQENEFIELYPPPGSANKTFLSVTKTSTPFSSSASLTPSSSGPSGILKNTDPTPLSTESSNVGGVGVLPTMLENMNMSNPLPEVMEATSGRQTSIRDYSYHYGISTTAVSAERLEMSHGSNDEDELDETTTGTGSDTSSLKWCLDEATRCNEVHIDEEIKTVSVTKGNILFDFIQIETGRGVLLSSKDTVEGPLSVVVHNFRQSATLTHHILNKAANGRIRLSRQMSDKKWVSKALTPISEHGILFNCDVVDPRDVHKKKPRLRQISYWVIGRIYPNQREVYLCYQDSSVMQNLIEVAFKLAYYSI